MEVGGRLNLKGQLLGMKFGFEKELLTKQLHPSASSCACEAYSTIGRVVSQYYQKCISWAEFTWIKRQALKFKPRSHWQPQSKLKVALDFLIDSPFSMFHMV
jgi:hypothetical protein